MLARELTKSNLQKATWTGTYGREWAWKWPWMPRCHCTFVPLMLPYVEISTSWSLSVQLGKICFGLTCVAWSTPWLNKESVKFCPSRCANYPHFTGTTRFVYIFDCLFTYLVSKSAICLHIYFFNFQLFVCIFSFLFTCLVSKSAVCLHIECLF